MSFSEIVQPHLSKINIPSGNSKIYKDECVFSFDNPESETGLYVCLNKFYGFGKSWAEKYFQKTGNAVFLHILCTRKELEEDDGGDGPEKKITRLAIGVEGGFDPNISKKNFELIYSYEIVILPNFVAIPWPDPQVPDLVNKSVQAILDAPSASKIAELEALEKTWDGEIRQVSKHAENLLQLENGKKIPPTGWQCEKCDLTSNLWLNLTDGSILCGRRYFDGTGGNEHALQQYQNTKYPLAVKLGTITKDGKGDVYSYDEDDMVEDPYLVKHLAHFGINVQQMEKTEKSMIELELELNQKTGEWAQLQESGQKLQPIFGPGFTGMKNLGNSCFLNSVMQVLFTVPDFVQAYVNRADEFFNKFDLLNSDPLQDFNLQMAKLGYGLLSGVYSIPPPIGSPVDADPPGISPNAFRALIGKGHPDFSTKNQQDAQEFFSYVLEKVNLYSINEPINPADAFKFLIEERYECGESKQVKYIQRDDYLLHLNIPLEATINQDEVVAYEQQLAEAKAENRRFDGDIVRPQIKLLSCFENFSQTEIVEQFYSSAINQKTTAKKTTRLATFPDYLMIHAKKFMLREDWTPIKLDVALDVPDELDLGSLRGHGLQPNETLLPETNQSAVTEPTYDQSIMTQLLDMGFPAESCKRALYFTRNSSIDLATSWLMEHCADSDFCDPFVPPGLESSGQNKSTQKDFVADESFIEMISSMGFTRPQAIKALKATNNDVERACDWILSHQDELDIDDTSQVHGGNSSSQKPAARDGSERYRLIAFISHMGTSTMVGHYVCHIMKDGKWIIYNDTKVAVSENPPKQLGYLYIYERLKL